MIGFSPVLTLGEVLEIPGDVEPAYVLTVEGNDVIYLVALWTVLVEGQDVLGVLREAPLLRSVEPRL